MKKTLLVLALATFAGLGASPGFAAVVSKCTFDGAQLDTIKIDGTNTYVIGSSGSPAGLMSTSCYGPADGNISGNYPVDNNIGETGDGSLNGGTTNNNTQAFNPYFLPPNSPEGVNVNQYYLPNPLLYPESPLVDANQDGSGNTDPGWIKLYSTDGGYGADPTLLDDSGSVLGTLKIKDLLTVTVTGVNDTSGTWALDLNQNTIKAVQDVLGRNAFDHLAFVLKSSTSSAVYDFDFNVLAQYFDFEDDGTLDGSAPFDFATAYDFTGRWNTSDFLNRQNGAQALSHLEIWVRDPNLTQNVPEPGTLALIGLGLLGIGLRLKRRA